jgi:hypothetical protein
VCVCVCRWIAKLSVYATETIVVKCIVSRARWCFITNDVVSMHWLACVYSHPHSAAAAAGYMSNISALVDKEHRHKSLNEIVDLPVDTLDGVGEKQKEVAWRVLHADRQEVTRALFFALRCRADVGGLQSAHDSRSCQVEILFGKCT